MEAKLTIPRYFDPKRVGEDLAEVALELIEVEDQEVQSRWFHSRFETDLFIWSDKDDRIIKQQITFYGQIVEWNFVDGVRTGYIVEDEAGTQDIKASEIVHFDKEPQVTTVEMALKIVEYVNLEVFLKKRLLAHFQGLKTPTQSKKFSFFDFLKRLKKK